MNLGNYAGTPKKGNESRGGGGSLHGAGEGAYRKKRKLKVRMC